MRRKVILSLTTVWLILGMVSIAQSGGKPDLPSAQLKAIGVANPAPAHEVILEIEGDYAFHTTRATGDTVLVDLKGVKVAGVAKSGRLESDIVSDYNLLQYMDSTGQPVTRVQLNLKQPETLRARRNSTGLRLIFGPGSMSAPSAEPVPAATKTAPAPKEVASPRGPSEVSSVKITTGPAGETYVDIATTSPAKYKVLHLEDPPRLVVDLEGARNSAQKAYPARSAFLKGIRVGQFREENPPIARVVADLAGDPRFDVHAQEGGVRIELTAKSVRQAAAVAAPATPSVAATPETKPVEKMEVPRPEEILTAKAGPEPAAAPTPAPEAKAEQESPTPAAIPAAVPVVKPAASPVEFQNALPAPVTSSEVAAAPKPEAQPQPTEEAIQAARAAMMMANTPGTFAPSPQEEQAPPAAEQPKYTGEPISLNLKDVDLKDFFRLIHEISGLNIIVDPNVTGNVTLVLDAVPWDQALDIVLKNNRLGKTLEGNVLRIARLETLTAEEEAAAKLAAAREEALPLVTVFRPVNYAKASTIATMLKSWVGGGALSKRGNILVDDRTNTLIISDIQSQIPIIESIINKLDRKAKQVQIEARIVLASADFTRSLGVSLSAAYNNRSGGTDMAAGTGTSSTANAAGRSPLVTVNPLTGFGVYAITNAGDRYIINAAIAAQETRGQAKTISKPTIVTQNNVPGTVTQGTQIPIQTTINNTISIQYVNAALTMRVTPQVTEDGNIFLDINVTNAAPGTVLTTAGPSITTQQATTQVLVPDGGTVVFGGVTVTTRSKSHTGVPVLGSIPILGHLFKTSTASEKDDELLFFISPKVLPG